MKIETLSSLGKMLLNLAQAAFIGLFINKSTDDFDLSLLVAALALTITGLLFVALSAKYKEGNLPINGKRLKVKVPKNTTLTVYVNE